MTARETRAGIGRALTDTELDDLCAIEEQVASLDRAKYRHDTITGRTSQMGRLPRASTATRIEEIRGMVEAGRTRAEIAAHLGVRKTSLNKFMKRHGLETFWAGVS